MKKEDAGFLARQPWAGMTNKEIGGLLCHPRMPLGEAQGFDSHRAKGAASFLPTNRFSGS